MNQDITSEQQQDINDRVAKFREGYLDLVKQYEVDFVSYPQFIQTRGGAFQVVTPINLVDKKYLPTPSPLQQNDEGKIIKE